MSKGMWIITRDLIGLDCEGKEEAVGVASKNYDEEKAAECRYKFRLLDGDDIVYCYGLCSSNDDEAAFAPLDDYGEGNWGCASIEYWNENTHSWEEL